MTIQEHCAWMELIFSYFNASLLDELAEFEEAWEGNSQDHLPGWSDGFSMHANAGKHFF